jgi:hypothetical protein
MTGGGMNRVQASGTACVILHAFAVFGALLAIAGGSQSGWPPIGWVIFSCVELALSVLHLLFATRDVLSRAAVTKGVSDPPDLRDQHIAFVVVTRTVFGGRIIKFAVYSTLVSLVHLMLTIFYGTAWHWAVPGSQTDPVRSERSLMSFDNHMTAFLCSSLPLLPQWFETLTHHAANGVLAASGVATRTYAAALPAGRP